MGPLRSFKVRGLRAVGRLDVRLDGRSLVIVGPSGSGKSTLIEGIADELRAELEGRPHPALDVEATGGADQQIRIAFVTRPVQLRWDSDFAAAWSRGVGVALAIDDARAGTRDRGPFDQNAIPPAARVAPWLAGTLAERHARLRAQPNAGEARILDTWLTSVRDALRTILGRPKLQLAFPDGVCALDLGDGRRPRIDELSRGHRTAIELFAELTLRVEAARRRAGDLGLEPPGLALIDGIERDLDPRLQRELLPLLARRVPNVQLVVTTSSPLAAIALDDAVVLDLGAHELRMTTTLRNEGLPQLVDRLVGAPPPAPVRKSSFPPPAQLPPRTTRPGGGFGDD
ncbi:MAG: hypothetical protein KC619_31820 [Myxococcales bacterium]|nr:hypothetical protein [Myxococcales bacterium]